MMEIRFENILISFYIVTNSAFKGI